jgi:hypothetical protein
MSFLFSFLKPDDPYYANWVSMRRRWQIFWLVFGLNAPAFLAVSGLFQVLLRPHEPPWIIVPIVLLFAGADGGALHYVKRWPCPRCRNPFYSTFWVHWPFATRCLHCKLPRYAPNGDFPHEIASNAVPKL